jgi:hypothetical protein
MSEEFPALDQFGDWVDAAVRARELFPLARPGRETRDRNREIIGFSGLTAQPRDIQTDRTWQKGSLSGEEISWSVGYGPRTFAWLLKPAAAQAPLPGVIALHGHDGVKFFGKEKIATTQGHHPSR